MLCAVCRKHPAFRWLPDGNGDLIPACDDCRHRWNVAARDFDCCAEPCPCCGAGIVTGGTHAHGDLLVQRCREPHGLRAVES